MFTIAGGIILAVAILYFGSLLLVFISDLWFLIWRVALVFAICAALCVTENAKSLSDIGDWFFVSVVIAVAIFGVISIFKNRSSQPV